MRLSRWIAAAIALGSVCGSIAQTTAAEAQVPTLQVGDRWTYRIVDNYTGQERSTYTVKVLEVVPNGYRIAKEAAPDVELRQLTLDLNLTQVVDGVEGDTGELRFPMFVGKKWRSQAAFENAKGVGGVVDLEREVVAVETVKVGAGTFSAFKVVARGQWRMKSDRSNIMLGNPTGGSETIAWYAPLAKAYVATETNTFAKGHSGDRRRLELMSLDLH